MIYAVMPAWKKNISESSKWERLCRAAREVFRERWCMGGVVWIQGEGTADGVGSHMQSVPKHHFRVDLSNFIFHCLQFNPLELCCPIW